MIKIDDLEDEIAKILSEYGDVVYKATKEGVSAGEKVLIRNLKEASPVNSGEYKKGWKGKGDKYGLKRYVGNTKTVLGRKGKELPLSNILEYSVKSPHQGLIKRTFEKSSEEIAQAMMAELKREV